MNCQASLREPTALPTESAAGLSDTPLLITTNDMSHPIDHIRAYINLPSELEQSMRQLIKKRSFRRGETISLLDNMRTNAFFIQKGSARVYYIRKGREYTFSFSFEDEFGTHSLFLLNRSDTFTSIEFLEPSQVYIIPHLDISDSMEEYARGNLSEIMAFVTSILVEHTNRLEERLLLLQTASATERYRWLITRYPKILERATITQIASFLGVTKETLYRIRNNKYNPNS